METNDLQSKSKLSVFSKSKIGKFSTSTSHSFELNKTKPSRSSFEKLTIHALQTESKSSEFHTKKSPTHCVASSSAIVKVGKSFSNTSPQHAMDESSIIKEIKVINSIQAMHDNNSIIIDKCIC